MNMLSAARITAEALRCKHTECPKAVLCDTRCADTQMTQPEAEGEAAALVALAQLNFPTDIQELLVRGNPKCGIAPNALRAAINAATATLTRQLAEARADNTTLRNLHLRTDAERAHLARRLDELRQKVCCGKPDPIPNFDGGGNPTTTAGYECCGRFVTAAQLAEARTERERMRERCAQLADDLEQRWRKSASSGKVSRQNAEIIGTGADGLAAVAKAIRALSPPREDAPAQSAAYRTGEKP